MSPPKMDGVVDAARAGGEWAWKMLYEDLAPVILGYVTAKGAADPEDLLGEVFLDAVRGLGRFTGDYRDFRAWMLTIAHHRMVDGHRKGSRRRDHPVADGDLEMLGPLGDVEAESLARIETASVMQDIGDLTPDQRDVLLLRVVADLSVEESARVLGKRPGAIKALQRRGLASLHRNISAKAVSR